VVGPGVDNVTHEITTERPDPAANSLWPSAEATTGAQPVIAEHVVVENGEWHGAPDRASFEAWHASVRRSGWSARLSEPVSADADAARLERVAAPGGSSSPVCTAACPDAPATHAFLLPSVVN
jgi:hypothetical protein